MSQPRSRIWSCESDNKCTLVTWCTDASVANEAIDEKQLSAVRTVLRGVWEHQLAHAPAECVRLHHMLLRLAMQFPNQCHNLHHYSGKLGTKTRELRIQHSMCKVFVWTSTDGAFYCVSPWNTSKKLATCCRFTGGLTVFLIWVCVENHLNVHDTTNR